MRKKLSEREMFFSALVITGILVVGLYLITSGEIEPRTVVLLAPISFILCAAAIGRSQGYQKEK